MKPGKKGIFIISTVKGKTEISHNLQALSYRCTSLPPSRRSRRKRGRSENRPFSCSSEEHPPLERIAPSAHFWRCVPPCRNSIFFFLFNGSAMISRPDIHLPHSRPDTFSASPILTDLRGRLSVGQPVGLETVLGCIATSACRVPNSARTSGKIMVPVECMLRLFYAAFASSRAAKSCWLLSTASI